MSEGVRKNTNPEISSWESELWSCLSQGDGTNCPYYDSCDHRIQGGWCLSDHRESYDAINTFVDDDNPDLDDLNVLSYQIHSCAFNGRIFQLIQKLAYNYLEQAGVYEPPVPSDLITKGDDNLPIEVRRIPMTSHHGAVWQLSDCWIIQLNINDTEPRQRFTLFHEIFHIIAHCRGTPVFKNVSHCMDGSFNELLADHFAGIILMPKNMIKKAWDEVRDIDRMAEKFGVPRSLVLIAIQNWHLKD